MRIAGIILVIIGVLMLIFNGFNLQTEKKVADVGPIEVNKKENKHIGWPTYAGGAVAVLGVVLVVAGGKKKS